MQKRAGSLGMPGSDILFLDEPSAGLDR